jgi:hypothetical protein
MLHGNLLLRGWHLSDVSFYTTELPEYMLVEAVHGLGAGVVHAGAALTYTLLVVGAITVVAAYLFARGGGPVGYSHEMAPALPFAAVLAGRLLAGRLISARLLPVAAVVLLGYALTLAGNAAQRPAPDADPGLTSFLAAHHLRYGLSGYWQADEITPGHRRRHRGQGRAGERARARPQPLGIAGVLV